MTTDRECKCVKPFVLFKGDDSNFRDQKIELYLSSEIPTDGLSAHFQLYGTRIDFDTIPEDGKFELVFSKEETAKYPLGTVDGVLWLEDAENRRRTVDNRIHFFVTNDIRIAYNTVMEGQEGEVTVGKAVNWNDISNVPDVFPTDIENVAGLSEELSGLQGKLNVSELDEVPDVFKVGDLQSMINKLVRCLKGAAGALVFGLLVPFLAFGQTTGQVMKAELGDLYNNQSVVTNVVFPEVEVSLEPATNYTDSVVQNYLAVTGGVITGSIANGVNNTASGNYSHAEGSQSQSTGPYSHAEGWRAIASGQGAHAEGQNTLASGTYSHAEGVSTKAIGSGSHAQGVFSEAHGQYGWAGGISGVVRADDYVAFSWNGDDEIDEYYSHGSGTYNINPIGGIYGFWIGEKTFGAYLDSLTNNATAYLPLSGGTVTGNLNVRRNVTIGDEEEGIFGVLIVGGGSTLSMRGGSTLDIEGADISIFPSGALLISGNYGVEYVKFENIGIKLNDGFGSIVTPVIEDDEERMKTLPEEITNIVREVSGMVFDAPKSVTWRLQADNGTFSFVAVTNTDVSAQSIGGNQ